MQIITEVARVQFTRFKKQNVKKMPLTFYCLNQPRLGFDVHKAK